RRRGGAGRHRFARLLLPRGRRDPHGCHGYERRGPRARAGRLSRMRRAGAAEASLRALAMRAAVLLGLIARAGLLYARLRLASRGIAPIAAAEREARLRAFAARFVAAATRFRGGLVQLGQVASPRPRGLPGAMTRQRA